MIRRQACTHSTISRTPWSWGGQPWSDDRHTLIRQFHVRTVVRKDEHHQTTGMRSFNNFTYFLELGEEDRDQTTGIRSFDDFTYFLEGTTVIRRQDALIQQFHVLSGVGEDDRDQMTSMSSFDHFTYELELERTTVIRRQSCAHSAISRTSWNWGGRP